MDLKEKSVSKDQQRSAGIALKARRDKTVDQLPDGSAKEMAKSMSMKELEKYASTKHKGLPEKVKEETEVVEDSVVSEEMLGVEEGELTTAKTKKDRITDLEKKLKSNKDTWTSSVNAIINMTKNSMSMNTKGARVAEDVEQQNDLDIVFENTIAEEIEQLLSKPLSEKVRQIKESKKSNLLESSRWQKLAGIDLKD